MFLKNILSVLAFALLIDAAPVKRSPGFVTLDFNVKDPLLIQMIQLSNLKDHLYF